jgi:ankyrin repeat protein
LVNDFKINPDVKDNQGRTVMHKAAELGADLMIYMLAEMGAQVNTLDHQANTPLHVAV